jgi:hypothetical protein
MLIAHAGNHPKIAASAWVAPDATVCGDVIIGPGVRVLYGARVIGEGGGGLAPTLMSWALPWRTRYSLLRERPSFMEPTLVKEQKCAYTQQYICEPGSSLDRPCRSAG